MSSSWFIRNSVSGERGPYSIAQIIRGTARLKSLNGVEVRSTHTGDRWVAASTVTEITNRRLAKIADEPEQPETIEQPVSDQFTADAAPSALLPADSPQVATDTSRIGRYMSEGQDAGMVERLLERVQSICTSQEIVEYMAVQHRPIANFAPDAIVLTNRRLMIFRQKVLGRMDMHDLVWLNCHDVRIQEGVLSATLNIQATNGSVVSVDWLPKDQARKVYRIAQEMEEAMAEHRRNRTMEETRAGATNIVVNAQTENTAPMAPVIASKAETDDPVERLSKLKKMLNAELISHEEYDQKKSEILNTM